MRSHAYLAAAPVAIAHRGGYVSAGAVGGESAQWQENTMAAFSAAVALGYRYLETDVHATSDGVLIAFHDHRLDRVTDRTGRIRELTFAEVSEARIGGEYPIPTLEELLTAFDGVPERPDAEHERAETRSRSPLAEGPVRYNVDLKASGSVLSMVRLVARLGVGERVCVASFSDPRLWTFRVLSRVASLCRSLPGEGRAGSPLGSSTRTDSMSRAATSAGPVGVAALRLLPDAVSRWVHSPGIAYQVPAAVTVLGMQIRVVTTAFVRRAHALGKQVHVWTVNDEVEMRALLELGVDGIVTDRVDVLKQVLAQRTR